MNTNMNIKNIEYYLLMKHIYDAVSISMVLTIFLNEPDIKKQHKFFIFSTMFICYVYKLELNNKLSNL
jgi:heme O synthase-like polyprenyltransferase